MSDKEDFETRRIAKIKRDFHSDKKAQFNQQEDIIIINVYMSNKKFNT